MQKDKIILSQFTLEEFSSVIIEKLKKEIGAIYGKPFDF